MSIKKSAALLVSTVFLLNIGVPIFAHSQNKLKAEFSNDTFEVCVSKEASDDELMEINLGDQKISLSLAENTLEPHELKPEKATEESHESEQLHIGQTEQITGVLPEVSVRYKMQEQGLKEDFILHSKEAQNSFDLQYDIGNLNAEQMNEQNILLLDNDNRIKTIISAPYMTDASGVRSDAVSLQILSKNDSIVSVRLTANFSWLQDDQRKYPVEVDPRYDTIPTKPMKKGDNNEQVALLKNMLFESGMGAGISMHEAKRDMQNNLFGPITERFIITFQRAMGLNPTGVADSNTLAALRIHLERKGILDTQEHMEQFLRRAESRSAPETGGFFRNIADFLGRVNLADLLVTAGTVAVVVGISAFCAPVTAAGIAYMLVGGAAIGAVANGVSEYAQQRAVGEEIDMGRVAIKAVGGAVKGAVCAIPGAGVGVAGAGMLAGGVGTAGAAENLLCSAKTTGLSWEIVADALINGSAQGIATVPAAAVARGIVNMVHPKPNPLVPQPTTTPHDSLAPKPGAMDLLGQSESLSQPNTGNLLGQHKPLQLDVIEQLRDKVDPSKLLHSEAVKKSGEAAAGGMVVAGGGLAAVKGRETLIDATLSPSISQHKSQAPQPLDASLYSTKKSSVIDEMALTPKVIERSPSPGGTYYDELQHAEAFPFFLLAEPAVVLPPPGVVIPFPTPVPAPAPLPVPMFPPVPIVVNPPRSTQSDFIGPKQWEPPSCMKSNPDKGGTPCAPRERYDHKKDAKQAAERDARKGGGGGGGNGGGTTHHPDGKYGPHYHGKSSTHYYYPKTVVVASGDSLWSIAQRYRLDHKTLARINGIKDPTKLQIGQVIKLG